MSRSRRFAALALLAIVPAVAYTQDRNSIESEHQDLAAPFLKKHCFQCHDPKEKSGDVILTSLAEKGMHAKEIATWKRVLRLVQLREMPPDDRPQPAPAERDAFVAWLRRSLAAAGEQTAASKDDPGRVTIRRLNRAEYDYTVQDLLHVKPRPTDEFPADDVGYGFDRIGDVLSLPPILLERYLAAGESIASEAILDWKPIKLRLEAEEQQRKGTQGGTHGGFNVLWSNGRIDAPLKVPFTGEYALRVRAFGMQAGPDPARMDVRLDQRSLQVFDVAAEEPSPKIYELKVKLDAGEHTLSAAFTNDFYAPDEKDPKQRDRNLAIDYFELEGPTERPALPWAHETYVTKRVDEKAKSPQRKAVAKEVLGPLVARAWRRPVKPDELERFAKIVDVVMNDGESFERGLQVALQAVLCSPSFLFRLELDAVKDDGASKAVKVETLDEWALASRLSYFIWSSCPDDELVKQARAGTLRMNLDQQVRRMIADPKANRLVEQFAWQWLQLRRFDAFQPDRETFPSFDEDLRVAARAETQKLFETVFRENRGVQDLIDPPFAFVNERLARHYRIDGVSGKELTRIDAPEERRGLLGQASVLMATSNPTRTSPVKRGRWVLEVLLDDPPPPPLPGTDSLKDEGTPAAAKTLRERLEIHRSKKECAQCHARMDALGFALERFDALGALRERDGENAIDDRGELPDGTKVEGASGLRTLLAGRTPRIARALAKKLLVFGLGRGPILADEAALDAALAPLAPDYKLQEIVVALTKLDAFHKRRVDGKVYK